ncbi:MAG: magnesium/cobalt transporter CorA [Kiloniellales bacterium]
MSKRNLKADPAGASRRRRRHRRTPPGASPGTLVPDPSASAPKVQVMAYDGESVEEQQCRDAAELRGWIGRRNVLWVNVEGLADIELIRRLGELFGLHRLALEDVVNVHQRPKVEEYGDHIFIVTRMLRGDEASEAGQGPVTEQVSLFLGEGFLLTFQEHPGDPFNLVRERLRGQRGQIRGAKADYLAYALLDAVIDNYFPVLERYGEALEDLEDAVIESTDHRQTAAIHAMKRDLLALRRSIWPQREMINSLIRDSSPLISDQTRIYLRDCYDHTIQLMDLVETFREIASGLVDVHLSSISARMNEIMKVLTIIATIFIPLGFIASLYGMNFDTEVSPWNMPELEWTLGYPFALGLMAAVAIGLLTYFWRKGWIGGDRKE